MKNFLNNKRARIFNAIITVLLSLSIFSSFSFEAKADLVDEFAKEYKLDPKNNPKDQCDLMNSLQRELSEKGRSACIDKKICELFVSYYTYYKGEWSLSGGDTVVYNPISYQILGIANDIEIDSDNFYEPSVKEFSNYIKKHHNFYMVDVRNHKEFHKLKNQDDKKTNFNDGRLRITSVNTKPGKNIPYLKVYGCYITESNLIKEYLEKSLNKNSK